MEKLPKFAIYLAIAIGVIIFTLFLYSILPHIIENSSRDWERAMGNGMTKDDLKALFYAEPAYILFKEKYPDAIESYDNRHRGDDRLNLVMFNYTNFNELRLDIDYNRYDENVDVRVNCQVQIPGIDRQMHRDAQGDGAVDFIEKMDCLNISLASDVTPTNFSGEPIPLSSRMITIDRG